MSQASTCFWVWAPGPTLSAQNSGSRMFMLRVKTLSELDCHWRIQENKNYRESSNIKMSVSVYWQAHCSGWISMPKTLYTRILDSKPAIDRSFHIGHGLELNGFHFAQFLLNARQAAYQPRQNENWELQFRKFRTDLQDQVMDAWSVTQ